MVGGSAPDFGRTSPRLIDALWRTAPWARPRSAWSCFKPEVSCFRSEPHFQDDDRDAAHQVVTLTELQDRASHGCPCPSAIEGYRVWRPCDFIACTSLRVRSSGLGTL